MRTHSLWTLIPLTLQSEPPCTSFRMEVNANIVRIPHVDTSTAAVLHHSEATVGRGGVYSPLSTLLKGALYRIQVLCRRYTFWSYPAGLTIADPPGLQKRKNRRVYSHHVHTTIAESIHTTPNSIQCPFNGSRVHPENRSWVTNVVVPLQKPNRSTR